MAAVWNNVVFSFLLSHGSLMAFTGSSVPYGPCVLEDSGSQFVVLASWDFLRACLSRLIIALGFDFSLMCKATDGPRRTLHHASWNTILHKVLAPCVLVSQETSPLSSTVLWECQELSPGAQPLAGFSTHNFIASCIWVAN